MSVSAYKIKRLEARKKKRSKRAKKVKRAKNFPLARKLMRFEKLED